ncbi:MAG: choice-of-anchor L domain-containing protein [Burkholderiales bacterium]|nr:choice-of-anchor L domain-containing protein [Burkholderiales bacterium]
MHDAVRLFATIAIVVFVCVDATGQPRTPSAHQATKPLPKIGSVAPSNNAAALAAMLTGGGVTITNARYTGAAAAAGTFAGAQASIGIDSGVVLSTGKAANVVGPNVDTGWSTDNATPGDPALDALVAPYTTFDAALLEFDATPTADTLAVRFVFASEEYNEFVGSPFNDVIAIFVNGVNCANYGGRPVSVNTINAGVNPSLYIDNETGLRDTELDGMTVPLECVAAVTPGVPSRVRIAIADTSDAVWDAAVFLAAGGVRSPGGGPPTLSNLVKVIEYRHAEFDHYFMTAIPDEIAKLDSGFFAGWTRTGQAFNVFVSGTPDTFEVCRFFSTAFGLRSSHFYTPFAPECASLKEGSTWQFEGSVFNVKVPTDTGTCAADTRPLYRLYNNGMGGAPNHRYTTDYETFVIMQLLGWIPEGAGEGVIACVPV